MSSQSGSRRKSSTQLHFRPFTAESFKNIKARITARKEKTLTRLAEKERLERKRKSGRYTEPRPNPILAQGRELPRSCYFPKELFGRAIEDVDQFYHDKYASSASV